jgi:poly-gamma-glutamate synthesis protein (capsule biosynthesis protein)
VWGEALPVLNAAQARIINLETSITRSNRFWPTKGIHYRMHPDNIQCLSTAGIDCCVLANNHVMDWGAAGLEETLATLMDGGIRTAGAGRNAEAAAIPAVIPVGNGRRVLVFAWGDASSGIPSAWAAGTERPGINLLDDLSPAGAERIACNMAPFRSAGDVVIVSLHWGHNWGYRVPDEHVRFAHSLIDTHVVDVIHGHSSHHPIGIERYRDKLILYGCGDLLNDYEGIRGHESFRGDLSLLYRLTIPRDSSAPAGLRMTPMQIRNMRLHNASRDDVEWLATALTRASAGFATRIHVGSDNELVA